MENMTIKIEQEVLTIETYIYKNNKNIALQLYCEDGEPYYTLTTNIVDAVLAVDEVCISDSHLPEEVSAAILATGRFEDTGKTHASAYINAPVWRVKCPVILAEAERRRNSR